MKNIIFIAAPAAGKGTQSSLLTDKYGYIHISTGDILREEIANGSELGLKVKNIIDHGNLVTDDIMINLISNKFNKLSGKPFIIDGFPRTLVQAEALSNILDDNYIALYLDLPKEVAKNRIIGRLTCICGKSYNMYIDDIKPKLDGICDSCGKNLIHRDDDNAESFEQRYKIFELNSHDILEFYRKADKLKTVSANKSAKEIFDDIVKVIND